MTKILIVEDEALIAQDIVESLSLLGYGPLFTVSSGEEALEIALREKPDAVLMDIHLRDKMDGIEAGEAIYSAHEIPIIFLTAYSDDTLVERARHIGSFGYLIKPFENCELKATLEMALYKSQMDKTRRELEKKEAMMEKYESLHTLAGGVAHNFNNMLAIVLGNLELAMMAHGAGEDTAGYIQKAQKNARRTAELSQLMLTYVGQCEEKKDRLNLGESLQKIVNIIKLTIPAKVELMYAVPKEPIFINTSSTLLSLAVKNLIVNSSEAIGKDNGVITLTLEALYCDEKYLSTLFKNKNMTPGDYAVIKVTDTGSGMTSTTMEKAFDPFFSTKFQGRGIGLAAALGAVQAHDGGIIIDESSPTGTIMRIFFPCKNTQTLTGVQEFNICKTISA